MLISTLGDGCQLPAALLKEQTLMRSWNGERCDTRSFAKLNEPANAVLRKDDRVVSIKDVHKSGLQVNDVLVR